MDGTYLLTLMVHVIAYYCYAMLYTVAYAYVPYRIVPYSLAGSDLKCLRGEDSLNR